MVDRIEEEMEEETRRVNRAEEEREPELHERGCSRGPSETSRRVEFCESSESAMNAMQRGQMNADAHMAAFGDR